MRQIKLTDGTVYPVDRCSAADGELFLNIPGGTMELAVPVFLQPKLTERIEHWIDGTEIDHITFKGYTRLISASLSPTGVSVILKNGGIAP